MQNKKHQPNRVLVQLTSGLCFKKNLMAFHKKSIITTTLTSALLMSPGAYAATVSYSGSFSGATDVTNQSIFVNQFDPSLGTLTGVSFTLDTTLNTQAHANNDGNFFAYWDKTAYSFSLSGSGSYNGIGISASNPGLFFGNGTSGSPALERITTLNNTNISAGSYLWAQSGPALTASHTFNPAVASVFQGLNTLNFLLTTQNFDILSVAGAQTGGVPASNQGISTNVQANVDVTYTYNAIPEPGTAALLASGFLGIAASRRKALQP